MSDSIVKRRGWTKRRMLIGLGGVVLAGGIVAVFVFDISASVAVAFGAMALVHPLLHMFGGHGHGRDDSGNELRQVGASSASEIIRSNEGSRPSKDRLEKIISRSRRNSWSARA